MVDITLPMIIKWVAAVPIAGQIHLCATKMTSLLTINMCWVLLLVKMQLKSYSRLITMQVTSSMIHHSIRYSLGRVAKDLVTRWSGQGTHSVFPRRTAEHFNIFAWWATNGTLFHQEGHNRSCEKPRFDSPVPTPSKRFIWNRQMIFCCGKDLRTSRMPACTTSKLMSIIVFFSTSRSIVCIHIIRNRGTGWSNFRPT